MNTFSNKDSLVRCDISQVRISDGYNWVMQNEKHKLKINDILLCGRKYYIYIYGYHAWSEWTFRKVISYA